MTGAALIVLVLFSAEAAEGARHGLAVCAASLIPSLFPFFVLSNLLSALGLPDLLAGAAGGPIRRLFRISGGGAQAFVLGITGGYPLGASVTAELRRQGLVSREEAESLLAFCNNSGPAFILGAAGGVLRSPKAGLLLYVCHILAAACVGLLFRGKKADGNRQSPPPAAPALSFGEALPSAAGKAISSTLAVCGYVVLLSALLACAVPLAALPPLPRALVTGFCELGSGIAALAGQPPAPRTLAAAAFLLGWGGLSVHAQTLGAVAGTDIKCARHLLGRALCGVLAAIFSYGSALLLF